MTVLQTVVTSYFSVSRHEDAKYTIHPTDPRVADYLYDNGHNEWRGTGVVLSLDDLWWVLSDLESMGLLPVGQAQSLPRAGAAR